MIERFACAELHQRAQRIVTRPVALPKEQYTRGHKGSSQEHSHYLPMPLWSSARRLLVSERSCCCKWCTHVVCFCVLITAEHRLCGGLQKRSCIIIVSFGCALKEQQEKKRKTSHEHSLPTPCAALCSTRNRRRSRRAASACRASATKPRPCRLRADPTRLVKYGRKKG